MSQNLKPQTISVPVNQGKSHISYDIFVDGETGLDVDPQSGDLRTREQTIEMVQAVYSVGAESMADELDRYNKWIQDPENKAKAQKLMTTSQSMPSGSSSSSASSGRNNNNTASHQTTVFTPEMALQKAADCRKRGNDWLNQKEYRKALKVYSEGLAHLHVSQRCGMLLSNRAEVLLKMLRYDEAAVNAEEAMRRFELLASMGSVVVAAAPSTTSNKKTDQNATTKTAQQDKSGTGSTMEILDDDDDENEESDDDDDDEEFLQEDRQFITISLPRENSSSSSPPSIQVRNFFFNDEHSIPHVDSVGPLSSGGGAAGQNLRSLWLKAAFRLVRAHEGSGNSWKALSVVLSILEFFDRVLDKKIKKNSKNKGKSAIDIEKRYSLPNKSEWVDSARKLFGKIRSPSVSQILEIPPNVANNNNNNNIVVAAPAVASWPSFQAYSIKRSFANVSVANENENIQASTTRKSSVGFVPFFGWSEKNPAIMKLQSHINNEILKPILENHAKKDELHSDHVIGNEDNNNNNSLQEISRKLGIDSFAAFFLHMAGLLLIGGKSEEEAKSFVVDGPVSLDRWLGRRPMFSYPEKTSRESDYFFVVAEAAAQFVQWIYDLPLEKLSELLFVEAGDAVENRSEILENLPLKLKTFGFTKEKIIHMVFAFSQIAHATRSTRNILVSSASSSSTSWCWLEAALVDTTFRIQYDKALRNFISSGNERDEFFKISSNVSFPSSERDQARWSAFGTFTPTTWGEIEVELVGKNNNAAVTKETDSNDDLMIPILFVNKKSDVVASPKRFDHAGFYGEIVVR